MKKTNRWKRILAASANLLLSVVLAAPAVAQNGGVAGAGSQPVLSAALAAKAVPHSTQEPSPEQRRQIRAGYGRLPLSFIENQGQADARIAFYIQSPGRSLYFTQDGHTLRVSHGKGEDAKAHTVKVELVGAAPSRIESLKHAPGIVSYFKGSQAQWKTAIPTHARIGYVQPWPGVDLAYDGAGGRLESIYTVAPHADPAQIKLRYSGQDALRLDAHGNLVVTTSLGEIRESAPVLYQEISGSRVTVDGRFVLLDENTVGFQVAQYNADHALVIDPTLAYAGYIGGNGDDEGLGIAVDSAGNAYVTGYTSSTEASFPVTVGPDLTFNSGTYDAFVAKVNAAGTALVYAGYIGGSGDDFGTAIAVDGDGNAYVTGYTNSTEASFPVQRGPDLTFNGGANDAFVAKVNAAGTKLDYCGYIGGSGDDIGTAIAVDNAGHAYVTGRTNSTEASFPVLGGPDLTFNGGANDAFVAKVNRPGTALLYAGYIGGIGDDQGTGIAVDGSGHAYVTGFTTSNQASFPVTVGPDLTFNGGTYDAFVAKVNSAGTGLVYAGYIGGAGIDMGLAIAVDRAGNAYVTGSTTSTEATFPVRIGPDLTFRGVTDAFVAKVNHAGTALAYAGFIGGGGQDVGTGIAVDNSGNAYVTGYTASTEASFPITAGPDIDYNGGVSDAFVAKVNHAGTALVYAGYIGGSGQDVGTGIAVDSVGNAYVAGYTNSTESSFPVLGGPDLSYNGGTFDAFVAKIAADIQGSVAVGGAPLVGTKVQLKNVRTPAKSKTTTDAAGTYQFDPVAAARYKITIGTFAVGATATVSGNLTVGGAPSVGTNVTLKDKGTGALVTTTTDASGNFSFPDVTPGNYTISMLPVVVP